MDRLADEDYNIYNQEDKNRRESLCLDLQHEQSQEERFRSLTMLEDTFRAVAAYVTCMRTRIDVR